MIIKRRLKFQRFNAETNLTNKKTLVVCGRTETELNGRIQKIVSDNRFRGWELR